MCLILDVNKYGDFLDSQNDDMKPVKTWLEKGGKIAYSPTKKFESELVGDMRKQFRIWRENGKLKLISARTVENRQSTLTKLSSNDPHIIALAQVANVKLLVSADRLLHRDFINIAKGRVYQTKSHQHLLRNTVCP